MARWGMVIDLKKCVGCTACFVACKMENFVPPRIHWNRVYDYETDEYPYVRRHFLPMLCQHCKNPSCTDACPTGATIQRDDGIVYVDYNKCIGCRYCMIACPYQSRFFNAKIVSYFENGITPYEKFPYSLRADFQRHVVGVVSKCTFCLHRIDKGVSMGLKPGIDHDATPACVVNCPADARRFGDLDDHTSEVFQLVTGRAGYQLGKHFGTDPSVYYLD